MFKNSGTKSRMINVMINEDYQMMNGRIKTIYNPDSPFVYDGRKDRTETAETTTTTESASSATTIKKNDEDWEAYFKRLQDQADAGGIVIGAYISSDGSSGHVMMITPGGLVDINKNVPKWGESFSREDRGINKVPRVLECGSNSRDNEAPLCKNVDYNGAINRLKWFQYK